MVMALLSGSTSQDVVCCWQYPLWNSVTLKSPLLQLDRLYCERDERVLFANLDYSISAGDIVQIEGPNGSGKTTLLRIISLLDTSFEGKYMFDNVDAKENRESIRKRVTMVFQSPVMFRSSVFDNIAYGLRIRGFSGEEIKRRVDEVLEMLGIESLRNKNARKLSGGEKQRVALARAFVIDSDVYALDEPTANLDADNVRVIENAIKEMKKQGKTIVLATHNLFQARRLADRTAYIERGEIVEVGDTKKLFKNPKDERTRRFIESDLYF